ncbi:40S ribosomal protein S12 [Babesia sp. Xinjiang]|uniref:40S ribosomal protein S12 n=1 Tax=Babesia sp. Xinjiang TaxID=462227 RepID=UPI000A21F725|nr:40S ribosomal protein S12 [Babesia sp. Xinjiang]ORM42245.1 40S ribosomal protein S12 [Babesia sp. Xinjiang]
MSEEGKPEAVESVTAPEEPLQRLLQLAMANGCLLRGIHQVTKALDAKRVKACVVSTQTSEEGYLKLIQALCKEHNVPCIETEHDSEKIGQWAGLCKYDIEGVPRHIVGATSVAITTFDEKSETADEMLKLIKSLA